jgi:NitT/TauT family transport system ATP-binding protein
MTPRQITEDAVGEQAHGGLEPMLRFRNVSLTFGGTEQQVLCDITLDVADREFVCIVGPSGSGKTTLLRVAHGLLPDHDGEVLIAGRRVECPTRECGFVFQSDALLPWRTVLDNVGYPLQLAGRSRTDARLVAHEQLKLVGLADHAKKYPAELSGGMRQRVNLARALAIDPNVLFMDEPFAALDAQTREVMQAELLRIWQERRKTVLFVTHQLDEAVFLADRVVVLGADPGYVKRDIAIDLPRPRGLECKRSAEFNDYVEQLWALIQSDVYSHQDD